MLEFLQDFYHRPDFWVLAAIPFAAALLGALGNWLAVLLSFSPLNRAGMGPFAWQGVIPARTAQLAELLVDATIARLSNLSEIFLSMEPEKLTEHITLSVGDRIEEYVEEIMSERNSVLWENLPVMIKTRIYARARRQMPEIMDNIIEDMAQNVEELVDLRQLVVRRLLADRALLVRLFREAGMPGRRQVLLTGAAFGCLFGLLQLVAFLLYPAWWVLPLFGLGVGYFAVWLGFGLLIRPIEPLRFGPFTLHGRLFRQRQEIAEKFCEISVLEVLNLKTLMLEMLGGPRADRTRAIIKRHMRPLLDSGVVRTAIQLAIGAEGYTSLKHLVADKAVIMSMEPLADMTFGRERSVAVQQLFLGRLQVVSNADFQAVIKVGFEDEEWRLMAVGAVLGTVLGLAEWWLLFVHPFWQMVLR
jgi:uncharacterized membrane protein YheB (UPF0754 family)